MFDKCYLCGMAPCVAISGRLRHRKCYTFMPPHLRDEKIQAVLEAMNRPFYDDDVEVEQRDHELWAHAFYRQLKRLTVSPQNTQLGVRIAALPPELQARIALYLDNKSQVARVMRLLFSRELAVVLLRQKPKIPSRESDLILKMGTTIHTRYVPLANRTYITDITTSAPKHPKSGNSKALSLDGNSSWEFVVFALDVEGCRTVSLYPGAELPQATWYRLLPRAELESSHGLTLKCHFQGLTLRDAVPHGIELPLFDSVPKAPLDLIWHNPKGLKSHSLRMTSRTTQGAIAITVAYFGKAARDVHFHSPETSSKAFYDSLEGQAGPRAASETHPIFRYIPLDKAEMIVDVAVQDDSPVAATPRSSFLVRLELILVANDKILT